MNLGEMRARAKQSADMENSSFVSDAEWNDMLNEAARQLYAMLVDVRGSEYYAREYAQSVTSAQHQYSLPPDFMFLMIAVLDDGNRFLNMKTWEMNELPDIMEQEARGNPDMSWIRYRLTAIGDTPTLELRPKPQSDYTLTVRYVPQMEEMISDGQVFKGINGWEKWVYLTAAMEALGKEESFEAAQMRAAERAVFEKEISQLKSRRDMGKPPRIVDTRQDWVGDYDYSNDWDF